MLVSDVEVWVAADYRRDLEQAARQQRLIREGRANRSLPIKAYRRALARFSWLFFAL